MYKNKLYIFSMSLMGILLFIVAIAMGWATFIERDYGTDAARYVVYSSKWFEFIIIIFVINLFGNILINKLYKPGKLTVFIFHISFIIIIAGAAISRYFGFDGNIHLRQNNFSNEIQTSQMFIHIGVKNNNKFDYISEKAFLSPLSKKSFHKKFKINSKSYIIESYNFIPHALREVIEKENANPVISIVSGSTSGRNENILKYNESLNIGNITINFSGNTLAGDLNIYKKTDGFYFYSKSDVRESNMLSSTFKKLNAFTEYKLTQHVVYEIKGTSIVFKNLYESAEVQYKETNNENLPDIVFLRIVSNNRSKTIKLTGQKGIAGRPVNFKFMGQEITLSYGPGKVKIPFALRLNQFNMERYPGSNSPSSYASNISIIKDGNIIKDNVTISMNNILRYEGYRFYQSSYDNDEKGSILSVNYDMAGTIVTYFGYFLLAFGMVLSVLNKNTRLRKLALSLKVLILPVIFFSLFSSNVSAQDNKPENNLLINYDHARKADMLLIQDNKGRIKPFNTLSSELLRKVYRNNNYKGIHSNQVILGMMINPDLWQQQPIIKISNNEIKQILHINGKYAAFVDFFISDNGEFSYALSGLIEKAFQKKPGKRNKFDNELIKVDERVNISYLIFTGYMFRVLPEPGHYNHKWLSFPEISDSLFISDSVRLKSIIPVYFGKVEEAEKSNNWNDADDMLDLLINFQHKNSGEIIPGNKKIKMEIFYNETYIFAKLSKYYGYLGFLFLVLLFISVFNSSDVIRKTTKIFSFVGFILFTFHTLGLIMRWYISGHAPWSNGYESLVYIAWATMLAGVIFSRQSLFALASTSILSFVLLSIAHLSWLDPEITNLVPVLKSYWLTIHVSVITASYGFLGLASLLALVNLILMIFTTGKSKNKSYNVILNLSGISEMSIIIGLYLITIGTFLGGVWANQSWGRYWAWDPKETWALITVIVYAFIAHMRFIPGFKGYYAFNLFTLIGYGSVIMTYFGVNYYLSGLHSYAKGDPIPLPVWVYYAIIGILVISILAWINNYRLKQNFK